MSEHESPETAEPTAAPMPEPAPPRAKPTPSADPAAGGAHPAVMEKRPGIAALLSVFPGIGNIYNGLYTRGLTFFAIIASCMFLAKDEEVFGFAVAFFWIFNIVDAYRQATLINYGYATDLGIADAPARSSGQGSLWAGVALIIVGTLAAVERLFGIDVQRVLELWPLGMLALGIWLVWSSLKERARTVLPAP